jgi:hypothetical protein
MFIVEVTIPWVAIQCKVAYEFACDEKHRPRKAGRWASFPSVKLPEVLRRGSANRTPCWLSCLGRPPD